jgi:glycosidase
VRDLIALRESNAELMHGAYTTFATEAEDVWAWQRDEVFLVVCNMSASPATVERVHGKIAISTDRSRDGERVDERLHLTGWEAAIVAM